MAREDIRTLAGIAAGESVTLFGNYLPGSGIASLAGSEATIGNLVREFRRALPPGADLEALKSAQVRKIILVTDYVASGKQVLDYVETLMTSRTLRSWHSFGWIQIEVVAFAVSSAGLERLVQKFPWIRVTHVEVAPTVSTQPWTKEQKQRVIGLCDRLGSSAGLGFASHGGLFAFHESIPNTLPKFLTKSSRFALFPSRTMPQDLAEDLGHTHLGETSLDMVASASGQVRLSRALQRQMRVDSRRMLTILGSFVGGGAASTNQVSELLRVEVNEAERLVLFMQRVGWLDDSLRPTERGLMELRSGKAAIRQIARRTHSADLDPDYYPQTLR